MLNTLNKKKIEESRAKFQQGRISIIRSLLGLVDEDDARIKQLLADSVARKAIFEKNLQESRAKRAEKESGLAI